LFALSVIALKNPESHVDTPINIDGELVKKKRGK